MADQREYEYDEESQLTLPEFFHKYKDQLPLLVIVTGGYCGESRYDDLSNNQVIRLHKSCRQLRALCRPGSTAKHKEDEFLTIPVDKTHKFTVVKSSSTVGEIQTLEEILRENKLPVHVRYVSSDIRLPLTLKYLRTSNILIMKTYYEDFIQGNCIDEDILSPTPTVIAISPEILVSIIKGYRHLSLDIFRTKLKSMDVFIDRNVTFPENAGCIEMTTFDKNSLTTGTGNEVPLGLLPDYMEPDNYEKPPNPDPYWKPPIPAKHDSNVKPPLPYRTNSDPGMTKTHKTDNFKEKSVEPPQYNYITEMDNDNGDGEFSGLTYSFISDKSVSDIQDILTKLNLSRHCNLFQKHLIDGAFLESLNEKILRNEFDFKQVEAIRLMMYIKTGHVPK